MPDRLSQAQGICSSLENGMMCIITMLCLWLLPSVVFYLQYDGLCQGLGPGEAAGLK